MYDIFIYLRPTFTKNVGNYIPYMDPMGVATFITKDEKQRGLFLIVGGILLVRTKSIQNIIQMKVYLEPK